MTESEMRELVSSTFAAAWEPAHPDVPLIIENEALPSGDFQILLTIVPTTSAQATMAPPPHRRIRRNGYAQIKLWVPAGTGTAASAALGGDAAVAILELQQLPSPVAGDEPVTFLPCSGGSGAVTDGRWLLTLQRIPFWYFERR